MSHKVTLIPGDGVGPEVTEAARRVIDAAGVQIDWEVAEAGAEVFKKGDSDGRAHARPASRSSAPRSRSRAPSRRPSASARRAPTSRCASCSRRTPTSARRASCRACPRATTARASTSSSSARTSRTSTRASSTRTPGTSRSRSRSSPARAPRRSSATRSSWRSARAARRSPWPPRRTSSSTPRACSRRSFEELAPEYPDITPEHLIIDNVAHQFAKNPAQFDVVVTTNLAGDIISDLASGLVGGLGFAASGNYGDEVAIFEAVHGSAPKYAGKNVINPTALILSSVMMLNHLGEADAAKRIEDAIFVTLEAGAVTLDVARAAGDVESRDQHLGLRGRDHRQPGQAAGQALSHEGRRPPGSRARPAPALDLRRRARHRDRDLRRGHLRRVRDGPDRPGRHAVRGRPTRLGAGAHLHPRHPGLPLRRVAGWTTSGWWRCRFIPAAGHAYSEQAYADLLLRVGAKVPWVQTFKLRTYGGKQGFTQPQG